MTIRITSFYFILFLLFFNELQAQSDNSGAPVIPFQKNRSVLFGYDTYINNKPLQNQRNVVICSTYNGWLYGFYSYLDTGLNEDIVVMVRSKTNGVDWSVLWECSLGIHTLRITNMDILACGNDTNTLKIFGGFCFSDTLLNIDRITLGRYDKDGNNEDEILKESSGQLRNLALASDDLYPAAGPGPFSIAAVFSKGDSIVFKSSSNGGMSFDRHYNIAYTAKYFHKVALAYGRSPSCSGGRYFAAWEEQEDKDAVSGHIYTAHSQTDIQSPFTAPVLLDSLYTGWGNHASNPVIACQNNNADNDSTDLTEVVLFERYIPETNSFNVAGAFNKKATVSDNFLKFTIDDSGNNKMQPDICFNAYDSSFIVTWFDSTTMKLPYYRNEFNMTDPNTWSGLTVGYNDLLNLADPHPQVVMDFGMHNGINAWTGIREDGNGASMFDASFLYYTGIPEKNDNQNRFSIRVFPNPASEYTTLEFELLQTEKVELNLFSSSGQSLAISRQTCSPGKHQMKLDLSKCRAGIYIVTLSTTDFFSSEKISVFR